MLSVSVNQLSKNGGKNGDRIQVVEVGLRSYSLVVSVVGEFLGLLLGLGVSPAAGGCVGGVPRTVSSDLGVRVVRRNLGKLQC